MADEEKTPAAGPPAEEVSVKVSGQPEEGGPSCCCGNDSDDSGDEFGDDIEILAKYVDEHELSEKELEERLDALIKLCQGLNFPEWFRRFERFSNKMPRVVAVLLILYFTAWKYITWAVMVIANDESLQAHTPRPAPTNSSCCPAESTLWVQFHTPFQSHPQDFGLPFQLNVTSHVVSAFCLMAVVFIPKLTKHRISGRYFLGFWVWHMTGGLLAAVQVLLERGYDPTLYPTVIPDSCASSKNRAGFSLWLYVQFAFMAQCVMDFLIHGIATIQWKPSSKKNIPQFLRWIMILNNFITILQGVAYCVLGVVILAVGVKGESDTFDLGEFNGATEYGVIFIVQCPAYVFLCVLNMRYWVMSKDERQGLWAWEHKRAMIFAMNVTVITFMANVTFRLAGMGAPDCVCPATPPVWNGTSCKSQCAGGFPDLTAIAWASIEVCAFAYWIISSAEARKKALVYVYASSVVRNLWGGADKARDKAKAELARLQELQRLQRLQVRKPTKAGKKQVAVLSAEEEKQRLRQAKKLADAIALLKHATDTSQGYKSFETAATFTWGELLCCCADRRQQVEIGTDMQHTLEQERRKTRLRALVAASWLDPGDAKADDAVAEASEAFSKLKVIAEDIEASRKKAERRAKRSVAPAAASGAGVGAGAGAGPA